MGSLKNKNTYFSYKVKSEVESSCRNDFIFEIGFAQHLLPTVKKIELNKTEIYSIGAQYINISRSININKFLLRYCTQYIEELYGNENYPEFAQKCLFFHPYADGNGRVFNHILCHVYSISKGRTPYMMYHEKSHEFISKEEMP